MTKIKVPFYSKINNCISCGCKVGIIGKSHIKKRVMSGFDKLISIWIKQKVLIDEKNHYFCNECFLVEKDIKFKYEDVDFDEIIKIIDKSFNLIEKYKRKIEKEKPKKNELKNLPILKIEKINDVMFKKLVGFSRENFFEISEIIKCVPFKLFQFLIFLKNGLSQNFSSIIFSTSQSCIS